MEQVQINVMSSSEKQNFITKTVETYASKLKGFIRSKVRNTDEADDILQEVWYQFSNVTNLADIVNISSWLYAVSRNKITDNYRKTRSESYDEWDDEEYDYLDKILKSDESDPEFEFFRDEINQEIFQSLEEIPEKQRLVFTENEWEGKTLRQIAVEQGENLKTIISRKQYAVKHLRKKLNRLYQDLNNH